METIGNKELRITGEAVLHTPPDQIIISFPVEMKAAGYKQTLRVLSKKIEIIKSILTENGIGLEKLKTANFQIKKNREWNKDREKYFNNGYIASYNLFIKIPMDTELTNSVILSISKKSPDLEFKLGFSISNKRKYENELIKKAIKDARDKAAVIADAAGITLKEIITIDYFFIELKFESDTTLHYSSIELSDSDVNFDYNPEDVELEKSITIKWRIE